MGLHYVDLTSAVTAFLLYSFIHPFSKCLTTVFYVQLWVLALSAGRFIPTWLSDTKRKCASLSKEE